ncbi:MAG: glycoside hydrolase family 95 protein, partial [Bacteroidota bacterium]|nr:glycoside hydrolase family 95 protein [Bacteroidota bacterium]
MERYMNINILIKIVTFFCMLLFGQVAFSQSDNTLWYKQPAENFQESMVLGNGKMGASVFGGIDTDTIYLNDATLWSGEPVDENVNTETYKNLPAVREALRNENYRLADSLNKKLQGPFSQSYEPLGTLLIDYKQSGIPEKYYRELNISDAVSKVSYKINGTTYTREYFISYPDQVMVIKLKASQKGALNFDLRFESLLKYKVAVSNHMLQARGYAPYDFKGGRMPKLLFDEHKGIRFTSLFKIKNSDGSLLKSDSTLGIRNATEAEIYISTATSFN